MKQAKKLLTLLLASVVMLFLVSCGARAPQAAENNVSEEQTQTAITEEQDKTVEEIAVEPQAESEAEQGAQEEAEQEQAPEQVKAEEAPAWKRIYGDFLVHETQNAEFTAARFQDDADFEGIVPDSYALFYVDDDDTPELLLNYYGGSNVWYELLYTIRDGEIVNLTKELEPDEEEIGFRSMYLFRERTGNVLIDDGTGASHVWRWLRLCNLQDGYLSLVYSINMDAPDTYSNWTVNDQSVSKEEYLALISPFLSGEDFDPEQEYIFPAFEYPNDQMITVENLQQDFGVVQDGGTAHGESGLSWEDAFPTGLPEELLGDVMLDRGSPYCTPVDFCDINQDKIPELAVPTIDDAVSLFYVDDDGKLHELELGSRNWVVNNDTIVTMETHPLPDESFKLVEYSRDEKGIYTQGDVLNAIPSEDESRYAWGDYRFDPLDAYDCSVNNTPYSAYSKAVQAFNPAFAILVKPAGETNTYNTGLYDSPNFNRYTKMAVYDMNLMPDMMKAIARLNQS